MTGYNFRSQQDQGSQIDDVGGVDVDMWCSGGTHLRGNTIRKKFFAYPYVFYFSLQPYTPIGQILFIIHFC